MVNVLFEMTAGAAAATDAEGHLEEIVNLEEAMDEASGTSAADRLFLHMRGASL